MLENIKTTFFKKTTRKKISFFIIVDVFLIGLSCFTAFSLRFDGAIPDNYLAALQWFIGLTILTTVLIFYIEKLYFITWSFVSTHELLKLFRAVIFSFLLIGIILFVLKYNPNFSGFPRSIIFISAFLVFLTTGLLRFAKRIYLYGFRERMNSTGKKILIYGAGEAGEQLARALTNQTAYCPIGFIDDNPLKQGSRIHNIKVLGGRKDIPSIHKTLNVDELIIAIATAPRDVIRETIDIARQAGILKVKILPTTKEILEDKVGLGHLREITIEDLLGREPIKIENHLVQELITDKKVLITGAAGSIGSHLCEQIMTFNPRTLIALDMDETGVFYLEHKLNKQNASLEKKFVVGNIRHREKIEQLFSTMRPDIVFHAAAYKHVPLMEAHPDEAVRNNILGLQVITEAAIKHQVGKFIFISTDKAVNPCSVMGMTKRVGEMICQVANHQNQTKFISVRFGNVLDSRGNVVALFKKKIKDGDTIEITHPDMKRYFMITSEAVLLVMQAGAMGNGGEVFVLDMGEPIKIIDLATEMIKLSGLEPYKDIPIVFTQPRPGEKLFEELLTAEEGTVATRNQKIFTARLSEVNQAHLDTHIEQLKQNIRAFDKANTVETLKNLIFKKS